ncbi:MAG: GNAT family N-acetyltransferase [Spirosomataceae bacterium]
MNNIYQIEKVDLLSNYYNQSLILREKILRKPLGLVISQEQIENEKKTNYFHFIAKSNDRVVSALTMRINKNNIQTCQIATDNDFRRQGIGKNLLEYGEAYVSSLIEREEFIVFSRLDSLLFYEKCNYKYKDDKIYLINNLEHRLLSKGVGCPAPCLTVPF